MFSLLVINLYLIADEINIKNVNVALMQHVIYKVTKAIKYM